MQVIKVSSYQPPENIFYTNNHLSTIIPGALKKYPVPPYEREKLELADGDFLLLDWWINNKSSKLVILSHGLEGNSHRPYISSCADYFYQNDYSILAWNQRSCGGEINRLPNLYHMGMIDDLEAIIRHALKKAFKEIYLVSYSMGGIVSLNYLGKKLLPKEIKSCVCFSTPLNLASNLKAFKKPSNYIYLQDFIITLKKKLRTKHNQYPEIFDKKKLNIKNFEELDAYVTIPTFGFKSQEEYYNKTSPLFILENISIPTLIVNAENDPFLTKESYLDGYEIYNPYLFFEKPKYGGHVGFELENSKFSWKEIRTKEFFDSLLS